MSDSSTIGSASEPATAPGASTPVTETAESRAPMVPPFEAETKRYTWRFAVIYGVLGAVVAGAITGLIVLVIRPGHVAPPAWSSWKPESGNATTMTRQIANHIAPTYRLGERGAQLVGVVPSAAQITSGTTDIPLKAIAIRRAPQSNTGIRIIDDTGGTRVYSLCGLGTNCSIEKGTPSETRGRLVRREALEIALYTFKYVPSVDQIITFMPPPPGETTTPVLFLEKETLKDQLKQPLSKTLPLRRPPLPSDEDLAEKATIDKLTRKNIFTYELTALQTGGAAIIFDPAT